MRRHKSRMVNASLQPKMSRGLGNYEPRDLPPRIGPGEGGRIDY